MRKTIATLTLAGILAFGGCDYVEKDFYETPEAQVDFELEKRYKRVAKMYPGLEMNPIVDQTTFYGVEASGIIGENKDLFMPWLHYIATGHEPTAADISRPELQHQKDVLLE
jgi:hypothetical protein